RWCQGFSFKPEVCDVDARVKAYPIVPKGIVDEMIQQFTHPGPAADMHVTSVTELHGMSQRLLIAGVEGILQLSEASIKTERHESIVGIVRHDVTHRYDLFPIHVDDVRDIRV